MNYRKSFVLKLKRKIVEDLLRRAGAPIQPAQPCEISSGLLYHSKNKNVKERFNKDPGKDEINMKEHLMKLLEMRRLN